ncbi:MAG: hypothetical protein ACRDJE_21780 [Dehalococcoidia bacterium]
MSVLQRLLHRSEQQPAPIPETETIREDTTGLQAPIAFAQDFALYEGPEFSAEQEQAAPPVWAPECGTPAFSTRHNAVIGGR